MAISATTALKAAEKKQAAKKAMAAKRSKAVRSRSVAKTKTTQRSTKLKAPKKSTTTDYAKKKDKRELLSAAADYLKSDQKGAYKPVNVTKTRRKY